MKFTVVDWNLGHAGRRWRPKGQADYLRRVAPEFVLLQEVDRPAYDLLVDELGDGYESCFSLSWGGPDRNRRSYGCAIFAKHALSRPRRLRARAFAGLPGWLRDLTLLADVPELNLKLASFHVPNASSLGFKNKRGFIEVTSRMLKRQSLPMLLGIDANGPRHDRFDPDQNEYWFHGRPEDRREELLHARGAHRLSDALRTFAEQRPDVAGRLRRRGKKNPLAVSHKRNRVPCRYDFIFSTPHLRPLDVFYDSRKLGRLSDHAPVVARFALL